ncbi:GNAT family N-acetyltransferase [Bosea psychrotolerans]|uniref:Putative N-acetyltransferase YhbS n=1 Tax=Bosea psychrotolerans TaxID=1871628 RepID=A0A2S4LV70_9HYPH|nr:GNAT family N-acetyltransferase [Bosea psychrotolerans]POR46351.1 putative N-acetyltransferase YhbS [Bosea psychrotolerans]
MSDTVPQEALILRKVALADAAACQALSRAVGWPHRAEDWEMLIDLGHGVVATLGEEIVASALWWPYGETHATLGSIIVSPAHQGGGIGKRLMRALLEQTQGRSQLLNATVAGEPLYARNGFVPWGSVHQHHGESLADVAPVLQPGETLRLGGPGDLPVLERLDAQATGLPRKPALEVLLACGECIVLERDGEPVGFSILRRFGRGHVIGPVVAANGGDAQTLIAHWLHERRGQFLRIDVPAETGLEDWLTRNGLKPAGPVTGMVRGEKPVPSGPARLYAVINQALG